MRLANQLNNSFCTWVLLFFIPIAFVKFVFYLVAFRMHAKWKQTKRWIFIFNFILWWRFVLTLLVYKCFDFNAFFFSVVRQGINNNVQFAEMPAIRLFMWKESEFRKKKNSNRIPNGILSKTLRKRTQSKCKHKNQVVALLFCKSTFDSFKMHVAYSSNSLRHRMQTLKAIMKVGLVNLCISFFRHRLLDLNGPLQWSDGVVKFN